MANQPDLLNGLTPLQRLKREREDAEYMIAATTVMTNAAGREVMQQCGFPHTDKVADYDGSDVPVVCARLDLQHPLYFEDNKIAECHDCGCDLQHRPDVPNGDRLCICCAARRQREEDK